MPRLTLRRAILKLHLWVGLAAALVLICAGLSGGVLAFKPELDRWLHPALYRVTPTQRPVSERDLLALVARARVPGGDIAGIEGIEFGGARVAQVFDLRSGERVFVNPYDGRILGTRAGDTALDRATDAVFQFHVRLLAGNAGEWAVGIGTLLLALLIPSGVILWWNKKRLWLRTGANWRQINWDLHNLLGIYGGLALLVLALSGVLLAWEQPLYWMVGVSPERQPALPHSAPPAGAVGDSAAASGAHGESKAGAGLADDADAWLAAADHALPREVLWQLLLPQSSRSPAQVVKHGPGGLGRSVVYVDRYDAHVLRLDDVATGGRAYRAHVINRALHTGEILGWPTRVLMSLSSFALAVMAVTGVILWLKRIVR